MNIKNTVLQLGWVLILCTLCVFQVSAQKNEPEPFKPGFGGFIGAGFNMTQIAGDNLAGFDKIGANVGVGAMYRYTEKWSNSVELSYSMLGSRASLIQTQNSANLTRIILDYADITVLGNFHDKNKLTFHAGFIVGRLIRWVEYNAEGNEVSQEGIKENPYNAFDYRWVLGGTFNISSKFGLNIQAARSIVKIGTFSDSQARNNGHFNFEATVRGMYFF